jgi:hypothetical protein
MHETHERSTELRGGAAHAHLVGAEGREKQDHPTANEQSRWQREEKFQLQGRMEEAWNWGNNGAASRHFGHKEIAELAHRLWVERGCPEGTAEADWFAASQQLRAGGE